MPPKAQINEIEQNRMVNPQFAPANIKAVANPNIAAAAESVAAVADTLGKIQQHNDALKMDTFEKQLDIMKYDYDTSLQKDGNPDNFGTLLNAHKETILQKGKEVLGERVFNIWKNQHSQNYFNYLKADTDRTALPLAKKLEVKNTLNDLRQSAYNYGYAKTAEEQLSYDQDVEETISKFDPIVQKELRDDYTQLKTNNYLSRMVEQNPAQVVKDMDDKEKYKNLDLDDKLKWKAEAAKILKNRQDTILDDRINNVLTGFNSVYDLSPEKAQKIYKEILKSPAQAQKTYNLKAKDIMTVTNYMEDILDKGPLGEQNQYAWAQVQSKYNNFDVDKNTFDIANKNLNNVESITSQIAEINGNLAEGRFDKHKNEAMEMIVNLRRALAKQVSDTPIIRDTTDKWFRSTLAEKIPGMIKQYTTERIRGGELSPEALGQIYEDVYNNAMTQNINLRSIASTDEIKTQELIQKVFIRNISKDYMLPEGEINAIASDTNMIVNIGSAPARVGFPIGVQAGNVMRDAQSYPVREGLNIGMGIGKQIPAKLQGIKRQDLQRTPFGDISNPLKAKEALEKKIERKK